MKSILIISGISLIAFSCTNNITSHALNETDLLCEYKSEYTCFSMNTPLVFGIPEPAKGVALTKEFYDSKGWIREDERNTIIIDLIKDTITVDTYSNWESINKDIQERSEKNRLNSQGKRPLFRLEDTQLVEGKVGTRKYPILDSKKILKKYGSSWNDERTIIEFTIYDLRDKKKGKFIICPHGNNMEFYFEYLEYVLCYHSMKKKQISPEYEFSEVNIMMLNR